MKWVAEKILSLCSSHGPEEGVSEVEVETITEGVEAELGASSTGPNQSEAINERFNKEELKEDEGHGKNGRLQDYDAERKILMNGLRVRAVKIGIELSHKFADSLILVSWKKQKIQELKSSLKSATGYERSMVLGKFVAVLEMVDNKLGEMIKNEALKGKMLNIEGIEGDEKPIYEILKKLYEVIVDLDTSMSDHPGLSGSLALTDGQVSKLERQLKICENGLEELSLMANELKEAFPFTSELDNLKNEKLWKNSVPLMINNMWKDIKFEDESESEDSGTASSSS
ncbi:hypothetical protein O6P43_032075 [Quillaja saponaria]|uniref:Uncharacterized protein n=1 Tax=Quillaja saponaria TaxID=32244 RepID=A0AAD7KWM4_QUISA|nr:hypothetical protein O6P43_032075 [Quillaja saponaria]